MRLLSYSLKVICLLFISILIYGCLEVSYDKSFNPITIYLENKFQQTESGFLKKSFSWIPNAKADKYCLVLGADINEPNLHFPVNKGYHLIAVESYLIHYCLDYLPKAIFQSQKIIIIKPNELNFSSIPELDIVCANNIFSFYSKKDFRLLWENIYRKLKKGGIVIANFLTTETTLFREFQNQRINLISKKEILEHLRGFNIIEFREIKNTLIKPKGVEVVYEVVAIKR